jgi:phytoene synthase
MPMFPNQEAVIVRRHDPDRYFATLFAPAPARDTLFTLYAFNHELARAREVAREPGLALIRLQWWRDVVRGEDKTHEVATPLRQALLEGRLLEADLLAMIDARETEAEPEVGSINEWREWLLQGAGSVAVAAGRALGAPSGELRRLRYLGAGYGVAGVLRSAGFLASQGRCLLPTEMLAAFHITREEAIAQPGEARLAGVHQALAFIGRALLGVPRRCDTGWIAAALPAVLARRDLAREPLGGARPVTDKMAMTWAAIRRSA